MDVCDFCLMAAEDEGIDDEEAQIEACLAFGSDIPDHECVRADGFECDCACGNFR